MEEHRYVLPSNVYQQISLDTPKSRLPLTDSTGNAQYNTVAIYGDQKGLRPRPPPNFLLPILPSQPAHQHAQRTPLEVRRSNIRNQRTQRISKPNLISGSEQYRAYRSRQVDDDDKDQVWPDDLEELFLEALCLLPNMGRRKFSLNGKPHGRNELISLYLWMGYCESLPPGKTPDRSKLRTRKEVSSHIQVLKGFMRNHPAYEQVFPKPNGTKDSFKNDPCLRALAQGRLPHKHYSNQLPSPSSPIKREISPSPFELGPRPSPPQSLRPSLFKMYMTTLLPGVEFKDVPEDDLGGGKLSTKVHTYSDSIPKADGYLMLELIPRWRTRFPILAQLLAQNEVKCDIIHMEASLELRYGSLPGRSELCGRFEMVIPGKQNRQSQWRCTQSLYKPADLHGSPAADPRFENINSTLQVIRHESGAGTHIRVSFPALPWAYALQRLSTMEAQFKEAVQTGAPLPTPTTARQYIDQITMYQEIFCSAAPNQAFIRKAIVLWTFKKCKAGEQGGATWRYLEPPPPRSSCFSPHPGNTHVVSAAMTDTFTAWANSVPQALQIPSSSANVFDPLSQFDGLPTPLLQDIVPVAEMAFPFPTYGYAQAAENPSFVSHDTQDGESTLVESQNITDVQMDGFLSGQDVLAHFNDAQNTWETQNGQGFDTGASFLANYMSVPSDGVGQIWDVGEAKNDDSWDVGDGGFEGFDTAAAHLEQGQK